MPLISASHHMDIKSGWSFKIIDQGTTGKNKFNPTKLNIDGAHRVCQHADCEIVIRSSRNSGLCDTHQTHAHDLLFGLIDPSDN